MLALTLILDTSPTLSSWRATQHSNLDFNLELKFKDTKTLCLNFVLKFCFKVLHFLYQPLNCKSQQLLSAYHLFVILSHFCKQCGPRWDCSSRSSLISVHTVCLYANVGLKSLQEYSADDINRRHFQMQVFLIFLAHLSQRLKVSLCDRSSSVVHSLSVSFLLKRHLLLNWWMDFEISLQECFLGDPLPKIA